VFVVLVAGTVVMAVAMLVELRYAPPLWIHGLILGPLAIGLCLGLLPVFKSVMVALQYRYRGEED